MSKRLDSLKIALRADSSLEIGTGHMRRSLCLLEALKSLVQRIELYVFSNFQLPIFEAELNHLSANVFKPSELHSGIVTKTPFDLFIFDNYETDHKDEIIAKSFSTSVFVIDDHFHRPHKCDIYFNQNVNELELTLSQKKLIDCQSFFIGPKYALIRQEFTDISRKAEIRSGKLKNIMVMMGGVDSANTTHTVLKSLPHDLLKENDINVNVVVGENYPYLQRLSKTCSDMRYNLYVQPENISTLMLEADLAIGAAGSSSWERCCLGLPSIVVIVAENQQMIGDVIAAEKCGISLNCGMENFEFFLSKAVQRIIHDPGLLQEFSANAFKMTSGEGAILVAKGILKCLRSHS